MADFKGFVGPSYNAPSITQDAQECINWYVETDPTKEAGSRGSAALYPCDGLLTKLTLAALASVRALHVLPGEQSMVAISGSVVYLVNASFVATAIGNLSTNSGPVGVSDNGISIYFTDGASRYACLLNGSGFSGVTDGGFTGGTAVAEIDGFLIYNRPNTNQFGCTSNLSSVSPALSFGSKAGSSDNIVTLIANKRLLYLLGEYTSEQWINVGAFPFPFNIIPGTSIQHGCSAPFSVSLLGEGVAWLAQDRRGQATIAMMTGGQLNKISTYAVESDINTGVTTDAIAYTYSRAGHEFYMITFPTQDKTWCYDIAEQQWHKRAWRDSQNVLHRHRSNCHALFQGFNLVGDYQNGKVYALDPQTYSDDGQPIQRLRRTPHLTNGLDRVFYDFLQIQFQPGIGLPSGQGSNPQCMFRWSDDGGETWSNYYLISIGKMGQYKYRAIKRKMGFARDRVYEVSVTDPVYAVIVSAEIEVS